MDTCNCEPYSTEFHSKYIQHSVQMRKNGFDLHGLSLWTCVLPEQLKNQWDILTPQPCVCVHTHFPHIPEIIPKDVMLNILDYDNGPLLGGYLWLEYENKEYSNRVSTGCGGVFATKHLGFYASHMFTFGVPKTEDGGIKVHLKICDDIDINNTFVFLKIFQPI